MSDLAQEFRKQTQFYLAESLRKVEAVWADLSEEQIWQRPNEQTLAPANQLVHLTGNMRQWVLATLGGQQDVRERDAEFALRSGANKDDIYTAFCEVAEQVSQLLNNASEDLLREVRVQGHATTALGVWVHQTEHLSYHTAQLVYFAKQLHSKEFDFYADWDLAAFELPAVAETPVASSVRDSFYAYAKTMSSGAFTDAIEAYYADDIVQLENNAPPVHGKATLLANERAAERRMRSADIAIHDAVVDEASGTVWGEMLVHFVSKEGLDQQLRQAFRQSWRGGKIREQRFYFEGFKATPHE